MKFNPRNGILTGLILFAALLVDSLPVQAQWGVPHPIRAQLISEVEWIQPGEPFEVGLYLDFDEKWHSYYKNPGASGLATTIQWSLPDGFEAGPMQWPAPIRFETAGLVSYGYEEQALHLVRIVPPPDLTPGETVTLEAAARWLGCKESCLPGQADLTLSLPVRNEQPQIDREWASLFKTTRNQLPVEPDDWDVKAEWQEDGRIELGLTWISSPARVPILEADPDALTVYFYADDKTQVDPGAPQIVNRKPGTIFLQLVRPEDSELPLERLQGVLVGSTAWTPSGYLTALRIDVPVESPDGVTPAVAAVSDIMDLDNPVNFTLMTASLFAFVGGLLLNLMPCVFPVLSIKILGFVQQAGQDRKKIFRHGLVFSAGVLVSFWALAGVLILLRAGGAQLGWGFQLQTPGFVVVLAILLFLFALNLAGVFEIGSSLTGVGGKMLSREGYSGSFFSGILATIIATPCTAPFMGSAIGFALTLSWYQSLLIFTFLALGMATPYMLLSSMPRLLRFLPRPGPWMVTLKQLMAFPLFATVIWLAWVLGLQTGVHGVTRLWIGLLMIALGAWIFGRWDLPTRKAVARLSARMAAMALLVAGGLLAFSSRVHQTIPAASAATGSIIESGLEWWPYSPDLVAGLREEGKPVFIEFSAAWCLTCQVNKRVAFSSEQVQRQFKELGITLVRADWTNRNPEITQALSGYGRSGVPLYVLYGPSRDAEPRLLPEVINPGIVLKALEEIGRQEP